MKISKYLFILFLAVAGFHYKASLKFSTQKIYFSQKSLLSNINDSDQGSAIFDQEFSYLDRGSQFYVFESADKKHVIKFMRFDKINPPIWARIFHNFSFSRSVIAKKKKRLSNLLKSSRLAASRNQKYGIVLHNLNGDLYNNDIIIIKEGNRIRVDLNKTFFLIQKKVTTLNEALSSTKYEKQQLIICKFLQYVKKTLDQNIYNNTRQCMKNVGVDNGKIIEFDIGDIHYSEMLDDIYIRKTYFRRFTKPLREYLSKELPDLVDYFDKKEKDLLINSFE